ncbi:MAG: hypothetical protein QM820_02780 [Minicystis sp.]
MNNGLLFGIVASLLALTACGSETGSTGGKTTTSTPTALGAGGAHVTPDGGVGGIEKEPSSGAGW